MDVSSQNFSSRIAELQNLNSAGLHQRLIKRYFDLSNDYAIDASVIKSLVYSDKSEEAATLIDNSLHAFVDAAPRYNLQDFDDVPFEAKAMGKSYGLSAQSFSLHPCNFKLGKGSITGVVGENGNGKTTLLRMIAGELSASSGELLYGRYKKWEEVKNHISYIPQRIPKWYGTLQDNMKHYAALYGVKGNENQELVDFYIHRLGLSKYKTYSWSEISTGYRLRFQLAKVMLKHPRLLVLDEPLANLDVNAKQYFLEDLQDLASSQANPIAIILSSQQLHDIEMVSNQIIFLKRGKPEYIGKVQDIGNNREYNTFELQGDFTIQQLEKLKQFNPKLKIEKRGMMFTVDSEVDYSAKNLMHHLSQMDISITYLRDISHSTKKYF